MRSAADRDGNSSSFAVPEQGRQNRVPLERDRPFRAGAARRGTIELNRPSINPAENVAEAPRFPSFLNCTWEQGDSFERTSLPSVMVVVMMMMMPVPAMSQGRSEAGER